MREKKNMQKIDKNHVIIGGMFDRIAPTYDLLNMILSFGLDKAWRKKSIRALKIQPEDKVLDIATGTGDMAFITLNEEPCKVFGIDLSHRMLTRALEKGVRAQRKYFPLQGDALHMPFADASFAHATSGFGVRNVEDMSSLFKEVGRVLKTGGRFSILELSYPHIPLIRWFHMVHLRYIMPFVGGLISRDFAAYRYLRDSVIAFPAPKIIEGLLEDCGFTMVSSQNLFFNTAHLYVAQKR